MTPAEKAAVEAMARAAADAVAHPNDPRDLWTIEAASALTALTTLHPGIGAVLRGEAVVMPLEPTAEMVNEGAIAALERRTEGKHPSRFSGVGGEVFPAYRAMLAASPYATPPTPGDAKEGGGELLARMDVLVDDLRQVEEAFLAPPAAPDGEEGGE